MKKMPFQTFENHYSEVVLPNGKSLKLYDMANYHGTIMQRNINGIDRVIKDSATLTYEITDNVFIWADKNGNAANLILFDNGRLSPEEDSKLTNEFNEGIISLSVPDTDGALYVDLSSLVFSSFMNYEATAKINDKIMDELRKFPSEKVKGR